MLGYCQTAIFLYHHVQFFKFVHKFKYPFASPELFVNLMINTVFLLPSLYLIYWSYLRIIMIWFLQIDFSIAFLLLMLSYSWSFFLNSFVVLFSLRKTLMRWRLWSTNFLSLAFISLFCLMTSVSPSFLITPPY